MSLPTVSVGKGIKIVERWLTYVSWYCVAGESLMSHADKFDKTSFQFCYIDGTDCVQGMSSSFSLVAASPISHSLIQLEPSIASVSCHNEPMDDENDFVEIEDEDGEIVIIKSRAAFLEEELEKLRTATRVNLCVIDFSVCSLLLPCNVLCVLALCLSIYLSVCLSQACIVLGRKSPEWFILCQVGRCWSVHKIVLSRDSASKL